MYFFSFRLEKQSVPTMYRVGTDLTTKSHGSGLNHPRNGGGVGMVNGANTGPKLTEELIRAKSDGVLFDQTESNHFQGRKASFP